MPNFSTVLSKSIVGLTASVLLIPVMSSSASAASLVIGDLVGIVEQNTSDTYVDCTPKSSNWTVTLSCEQRYTAKSYGAHSSLAGKPEWRKIVQDFKFTGNRGRRYKAEYFLEGKVISSLTLSTGLGRALAYSDLKTIYNSHMIGVNLITRDPRSLSDWDQLISTNFASFEFNGGSTWQFSVGARTFGFAEATVLGVFAQAKSNINFKSTIKIKDIGRSRSSPASLPSFASASSYQPLNASDDEVASVPDEDLINFPDEDVTNISGEDLINLPDDDVANISDEDVINLPGDDVVASVPESSTVAGLAVVLTILLATKRSRFAKKHTEDTENLVNTTAVEV